MSKADSFHGQPIKSTSRDGRTLRYVANQIVVKLKPEFHNDEVAQRAVLRALPENSVLQGKFDRFGMAVVNLPPGSDPLNVAQDIEGHEALDFVEPNYLDSGS